jgi:pro-kumamolisin-like protein/Big-like domain-containing protein
MSRICARVCAFLLLACCALPMAAQQPATTSVSATLPNVKLGAPTPHQVVDGTAQLVKHYDPNQKLRLVFGLQPPHMGEERKFLKELGTKGSKNYRNFLTPEEWNKRFAPSKNDEQAVVDWAKSQGLTVTGRYPNRLLVDVEAPVSVIEPALNLKINSYQLSNKTFFSNDRDPILPAGLIIHSVGGLNNLQVLRPTTKNMKEPQFPVYAPGPVVANEDSHGRNALQKKMPTELQSGKKLLASSKHGKPPITGGAYDPTDIYSSQAYDLNALYAQGHCCNPLGNPNNSPVESSIAIATAGAQQVSDMQGFQAQYPYLAYNFQEVYVDGTPSCCDGEGTLDLEWSTAWSNSFGSYVNTSKVWLYDGVNNQFSTFTDVYNAILNDGNARVFSTSWGCEELYCTPQSVMDTDDAIFSSMVGQGWTLVAATGDQGATAGCANFNTADAVQFPASDPNIVGAGGTTLSLDSNSNYISEVGWTGGPLGCGSNDGGSTGGFSSYYAAPFYQSPLGFGSRGVPDIALNADWYYTPQNYYFNGGLSGNGGTSIVAPEMAGFFAQENSYLDYVATINGGCYGTSQCAPIGNGNWYLYYFGENTGYAPHYPFYDITSGCNNNDITSFYGLGFYCAGGGWDAVTGWGSINSLQLAWAINTYRAGDFSPPTAGFFGAAINAWYNTDQYVAWNLTDTSGNGNNPVGVAGFSQAWDSDPGDVFSEATPGSGNTFYSGPQYPNGTSGCLSLAGGFGCSGGVSQGCHTANVRAWDNSGFTANLTYGPVCYDTVAPVTTAQLSGNLVNGIYESAVTVTLTCTDSSSGCAATYYQVDGGSQLTYSAPFQVASTGNHTVTFHSVDVAGNVEQNEQSNFHIEAPTSTTVGSSVNPSEFHQPVTFKATVTATFGGTPNGTVQFKDGASVLGNATLSGGVATFSTSGLAVGSHSITAVYTGNVNFVASTSGVLTQMVNKAKTTTGLTSSANPSHKGKPVTFSATVHPAFGGSPSGTVTFKDGTKVLGTGKVNASTHKATFTTTKLSVGTHSISAHYPGDTKFLGSKSTVLKQVVKP